MPRLRAVALLAVAAGLSACTEWGAGPDIAGATANAVTIRYDSAQVSAEQAEQVAQRWCAGFDKRARLRSRFGNSADMTYADYACAASQP